MKSIRQIAGLILLMNGLLHFVEYANTGAVGYIIFGSIYTITSLLLFNKKAYPVYLGLVLPLIGMSISFAKFGIPELFSLSALFKLMGLMVICCCAYILVNRKHAE